MEFVTTAEQGFVIKSKFNNGYFELNGLGDWTLAGNPMTAEIFSSESTAQEVIDRHKLDDVQILRFSYKFQFNEENKNLVS